MASITVSTAKYYDMLKSNLKYLPSTLEILRSDMSDIKKVFEVSHSTLGVDFCRKQSPEYSLKQKMAMMKPFHQLVAEMLKVTEFNAAVSSTGIKMITDNTIDLNGFLSGNFDVASLSAGNTYELLVNSEADNLVVKTAKEDADMIAKYHAIIKQIEPTTEYKELISSYCSKIEEL